MKKFIKTAKILFIILIFLYVNTYDIPGEEQDNESKKLGLNSLSAVLMDADSGRVLYGKEENEKRPMASTTKIMTCILAIEYGNLDDIVTVSKYAASMPDVQLNMQEGQYFVLRDLLYSLMLESHNDTAVAIAEHIGGSVENFAVLMNEKAKDIGCYDTYFITPNGLDATKNVNGTEKVHSTTAENLAKIMSYCIKNQMFLDITRSQTYQFNDIIKKDGKWVRGSKVYVVNNKNRFLTMMEGALSGKTGFTQNAGYCYVGALKREGRTYVVALLGCGWPNNKNLKWEDTKLLMNYGLEYFMKNDICVYNADVTCIEVRNGTEKTIMPRICVKPILYLTKNDDEITYKIVLPDYVNAPVKKNQAIGYMEIFINGREAGRCSIVSEQNVKKVDFSWSFQRILDLFVHKK